ncbi:MAG: hypothetical protein M3140_01090 [Actinomycetota bacterium]|nr:hypothetical protein [Actinomycetota bacterium]
MTVYRPSNVMGTEARLVTVIQYVEFDGSARSTATDQSSSGAPLRTVVGIMYQTTCHFAGQPKVNHRPLAPAVKLPVHWVPVHMALPLDRQ